MNDKHKIFKINEIINETNNIKTFLFNEKIEAEPGQFIIVWLPRIDEKPFGISYFKNNSFGITVSAIGDFTKKMNSLKVGDKVGIRGVYGTKFNLKGKNIAIVAGGIGAAPLSFLAEKLYKKNVKVNFIIGANTKNNIPYINRYKNINMTYATEDGSLGIKGYSTDALIELTKKENIDMIYTCGPEIMMKKVLEISDKLNIDCEFSLERYMKCGFGVCGQCCVDPTGWRVCKEGPVFSKEQVKKITEFGNYKRSASGKKEYYASSSKKL